MRRGFQNEPGKDLDCLVFDVSGRELELRDDNGGKEHEKWSQILKIIGKLDCYKEFGFLKIHQMMDSSGAGAQTRQDETGKYSFALKPACLYFLDVIQHVPWKVEEDESIETPYDVELKAEKDEVILLRKVQRVVGKYDLLRFIFKTPSGYASRHTFLEVESKQGGDLAKYGLPALFLPVFIKPPVWMKLLRGSRYVLATIAIMAMIASEPLSAYLTWGTDWVRGVALFLLVLASGRWEDFVGGFIKDSKEIKLSA